MSQVGQATGEMHAHQVRGIRHPQASAVLPKSAYSALHISLRMAGRCHRIASLLKCFDNAGSDLSS